MHGEHPPMTYDELQAMLSADEEHWWLPAVLRRPAIRAAVTA